MPQTIPVMLPDEIIADMDALSTTDGVSRDQLIGSAVEEYLANRKFHDLRARVVPQARQAGFVNDEDVFRQVS